MYPIQGPRPHIWQSIGNAISSISRRIREIFNRVFSISKKNTDDIGKRKIKKLELSSNELPNQKKTDKQERILDSSVSQLDIAQKVSKTDLTCRLSKEQQTTLTNTLQSLPNVDQSIKDFLKALNQGDWKAQIFDDENFPHYALLSYMQGLITIEQFGTIQTYWTLLQEKGKDEIKIIRLFNADGSVNKEAKAAIE